MIERIHFLEAGFCTHPECTVIRGGRLAMARFPAVVAALVHRRHGVVLFDTGYAPRFHAATRRGWGRLYAMITPVTTSVTMTAAAQLARLGIAASDVRWIVLSHFHADHIAGLRDFPNARCVFRDTAYQDMRGLRGWRAVRKAFLPELLPEDFEARARPIAAASGKKGLVPYPSLGAGYDLLGDGSVVGVDLPGHAAGHMGILVESGTRRHLLIGDAAWQTRSVTEGRPPAAPARLIMDNYPEYLRTLGVLHELAVTRPELEIMPCHCEVALARGVAAHGEDSSIFKRKAEPLNS